VARKTLELLLAGVGDLDDGGPERAVDITLLNQGETLKWNGWVFYIAG
jgi:hypothetical protein